ncbi:MAG TPA: flagellar FliJ family protein [Actinophytocola sp.]|uniref:flagellar FliJ family protein n=1 Tax=Actinophytocola sp. TaxID=1872138 RepID=UPI002DB95D14|nr:flagellar FliJ family protein [Actinophytocola sp.]HEU5474214.1 flagellar FliJ family protein [Actinophytocola sp.]
MVASRLVAVLRARRVQEDVARGDVARANAEVDEASSRTAERAGAVDRWSGPDDGSNTGFLASVAAGRALVDALSAATAAERSVRAEADVSRDRLLAASQRRRSVEKLVERAAAAHRQHELATEQRVVDDLATGRRTGEAR